MFTVRLQQGRVVRTSLACRQCFLAVFSNGRESKGLVLPHKDSNPHINRLNCGAPQGPISNHVTLGLSLHCDSGRV